MKQIKQAAGGSSVEFYLQGGLVKICKGGIGMKIFLILVFAAMPCASFGQDIDNKLRSELLAMERVDQEAREKCVGTAEEQAKCLVNVAEKIDAPHTKRLAEIFTKYGFPSRALVRADGQKAFMLLLQHSPTEALRVKAVSDIKRSFEKGELDGQEFANFMDRYLLRQGKPQIYGTGFESKDGKLVLSPTEDIKNLDARRKTVGLPPISEYAKTLREVYKLEVILPQQ